MTRLSRLACALAAVAAFLIAARPAPAVIQVNLTLETMYGPAKSVLVARITKLVPENNVVLAEVTQTLKGDIPGAGASPGAVRLVVAGPEGLFARLAVGQPVVLFSGNESGSPAEPVHLADTLTLGYAVAGANPPTWQIRNEHDRRAFPGRSEALARALEEHKAGRKPMLNRVEPNVFTAGVKQVAALNVKPTFLTAASFTVGKKPDLLVGTAQGVRLFAAMAAPAPGGYQDVTAGSGLAGAPATMIRAVGDFDGDGKPDLLLGNTLWRNEGGKFAAVSPGPALPAEREVLAAALAEATGDNRPDVLVLSRTGELLVYENPGAIDKPWPAKPARALWQGGEPARAAAFGQFGDTTEPAVMVLRAGGVMRYGISERGGAPADFTRLTGELPPNPPAGPGAGPIVLAAVPLDVNGDGRQDLLIVCDSYSRLFIHRGFGVFFYNDQAGGTRFLRQGELPFKLEAGAAWAAGDLHGDRKDDLLVLTAQGRLYQIDNTHEE